MKNNLLVKVWREHKHLTQGELSKVTGISLKTINNWEKGHTSPDYKKLRLLSKALNITLEEFQKGPGGENSAPVQQSNGSKVPQDIEEKLQQIETDTGIGADILIRAALGGFVTLKRSEQLSVLRQYFDTAGNQIEEMINNLDDSSDQDRE